jgi:Uma2 family endonuclease
VAKYKLYQKYGVKEYWIVDRERQTVEVFRLQHELLELNAKLSDDDEIVTPLLPGFSCLARQVFALPNL